MKFLEEYLAHSMDYMSGGNYHYCYFCCYVMSTVGEDTCTMSY